MRVAELKNSFNTKQGLKQFSSNYIPAPSKELKVVNFDSEYEITFSLVNEKPEVLDWNWNIEYFVESIINLNIFNLSYFDSYKINAEKESGTAVREFYLKPTDLSIMTNFIENRLGSRISDSSALEFVTYVPSKQPMYILDNENQKLSSFLVPRWGGIFVYNQENKEVNAIENDDAMKIFLTQFLQLIGVNLNKVIRFF